MSTDTKKRFEFNEEMIETVRTGFLSTFKFKLLLFLQLPMGFKSKMRVTELTRETCKVTVPYNRRNKNPFNSTFWAVLGMAAEMSSGAFVMMFTAKQKPSVATLVVGTTAKYYKKAVGVTTFVCNSGKDIENAIRRTQETGEAVEVVCPMIGYNEAGDELCEFSFTWSFKRRSKK